MEVSLTSVTHTYRRGSRVLDLEDLALAPGVTGLVGVNGAGKSTLLRCLAGAQRPTGGTVHIDGVDLYDGRHRATVLPRIGLMPQELTLPRDASTLDTITYVAWVRGTPLRRARAAAEEVLAAVGLDSVRSQPVRRLSGGMVRRLCLAQALVLSPSLLLLDEPTTGLDPEQRATLRDLVAHAAQRGGTTVVSSHVMEDITTLAPRILVLHEGRVLHHGPTGAFAAAYGGPRHDPEVAFLATLTAARSA